MSSGVFLESLSATSCNPEQLSYHYNSTNVTNETHTSFSKAQSRKRNREAIDEDDQSAQSKAGADDGPTKPRRVDPSKLALRLDPDLVKEMDKFIVPGALMPSFSIRKELQQRYNVDRRHLYDYFHSRGLRVAKEDKFNNLARSRAAKARQEESDSPKPKTDSSEKRPAKRTKTSHEKAAARPPFKAITPNVSKDQPTATHTKSYSGKSLKPHQMYIPRLDVASTHVPSPPIESSPVIERTEPSKQTPQQEQDERSHMDESFDDYLSELQAPPSSQELSWDFEFSRSSSEIISDDDDSLELQYPETPKDDKPLFPELNSQEERQNFYNSIIECIGPISPMVVQESVGSYKTYMDNQHLSRFSASLPKFVQPSSLCSCISGLPSGPCLACGVESQPNYGFPPDVFNLESTFFTDEITSATAPASSSSFAHVHEVSPYVPQSSVSAVHAAPSEIPWLNASCDGSADLARFHALNLAAGGSPPSVNGSAWWLLAPYSGVSA